MMLEILSTLGAAITLLLGLVSMLAPALAARFVGLAVTGPVSDAELRATWGGFFAALGATCLYLQEPLAYQMLGLAWLAASVVRTLTMVVRRAFLPLIAAGAIFEATVGLLCLANYGLRGF